MFSTISNAKLSEKNKKYCSRDLLFGESNASQGWALHGTTTVSRFSDHVKTYLLRWYDYGERTGHKADPAQVARDMRNARDTNGEKLFNRNQWLKESQIKSFFSRVSASRKKSTHATTQCSQLETLEEEDINQYRDVENREDLLAAIDEDMGLKHPIMFEMYDICEYSREGKLQVFTIALLKEMLDYFEVAYSPKQRKAYYLKLLDDLVKECTCSS